MTEQEFIEHIRPLVTIGKSQWHDHEVHYMGSTILTSKEMMAMLSAVVDGFNDLPYNEKRKMRVRIFDALKE